MVSLDRCVKLKKIEALGMKVFLLLLTSILVQDQVPFKAPDEFQVNIDLKFKFKMSDYSSSSYSSSGDRLDKPSSTTLPFLTVIVKQIKILNDETRIIAINSSGKSLMKKKASPNLELHFEMGFVADLKSKASPSEITVYFLSKEKKELRKIVLAITTNGAFEVNGQWRGQF